VDTAARRCLLGDREIELRPKKFELLVALARHPIVDLTREDLMAQVWVENWFGSTKTLDVTMPALRPRLSEAVPPPTSTEVLNCRRSRHCAGTATASSFHRQHELKAPCRRGAPQLRGDLVVDETGGRELDSPGTSSYGQRTVAVFDE